MGKELLSEEEVKKQLGINDFRSINKKQIIEFVSSIPEMSKEVAIKCIEQFPDFMSNSVAIVEHLSSLCTEAIKDDGKETLTACKETLQDLRTMLKKDKLSEDMQRYVIEKIVDVTDKMAAVENDSRNFKINVLRIAAGLGAVIITIGSTILGVKIFKD